jgi:pimeloyl-ACP methyl ester carboxylesterase
MLGARLADLFLKSHDIGLGSSDVYAFYASTVPPMSGWFPKPAGATERRVATARLTMNIVEAGSGPTVLLLHGLGWDHSLWNPTVERFAPKYRMIAADTRGHGATDKPDGP